MNLANFQSKNILSAFLLFSCIIISLLLSDIPYIVKNFFPVRHFEGMSTNNSAMITNILNVNKITDTNVNTSDKIILVRKHVNNMDEGSDEQKKLSKILDDISSKDSSILANVVTAAQNLQK